MSPPSEAEIAAAKKARDDAKKVERAAEEAENHALQASVQRDTVEHLREKLANAEARATKANEALVALGKPASIHPVLDSIIAAMDISLADGICYVCEAAPPSKHLVEVTKGAVAEQRAKNTQHDAADHELQTATIEASNLRNLLEGSTRLLNDLVTQTYTGPSLADARGACDKAEDALQELRGARSAWDSVQKAESVALDCERRAGEWKALKEACEAAVGGVLDTARAAFIAKVQSKLPASDTFALNLRDGEREVVQFGLVRDGKLHTALSGAEWARVMAAMAESCVEPGKYACIIPEERAFDEFTLFDVLKALGTSEHQVIITSPVHPAAIPEGWTLIPR